MPGTPTTNYNLTIGTIFGDDSIWGTYTNDNMTAIDTQMKVNADAAVAAQSTADTGVTDAATAQAAADAAAATADAALPKAGGTLTGDLIIPSTSVAANVAVNSVGGKTWFVPRFADVYDGDLNALDAVGGPIANYKLGGLVTNVPAGVGSTGNDLLEHRMYNVNTGFQTYYSISATVHDMYTRELVTGVWGGWRKLRYADADFISTEVVITTGLDNIVHGLGAVPSSVNLVLRCTTNDSPYGVGAELQAPTPYAGSGTDFNCAVSADDTNISIRTGANGIQSVDNAGQAFSLLLTSWRFVVRASL